jgi:hypothetical protein
LRAKPAEKKARGSGRERRQCKGRVARPWRKRGRRRTHARRFSLASGLRSERSSPPRSVLAGPDDKLSRSKRRTRNATPGGRTARPGDAPQRAEGRGRRGVLGNAVGTRGRLPPETGGPAPFSALRGASTHATRFRLLLDCRRPHRPAGLFLSGRALPSAGPPVCVGISWRSRFAQRLTTPRSRLSGTSLSTEDERCSVNRRAKGCFH